MKLLHQADGKPNQKLFRSNYLIEKKPCSEKYKPLED
jgi:hypothetical protein